jgi:AcrR family transcriptional regulator
MASFTDASAPEPTRPFTRQANITHRGGPAAGARDSAPPGKAHTTEGHKRRADIVASSAKLFDARGYADTSMEDIALAVGIAKPTIYHYFSSKSEILVEIHETFINLLIERQEDKIRSGAQPAELLRSAIGDILDLMDTHRAYVRVFFEHHRELPLDDRRESRRKRDHYEWLVTSAISDGARLGVFEVDDPRLAALAVFGVCNWAYQWWRTGRDGRSADELADFFFGILMNGIAARPGQRPASLPRPD